MKLVEKVRSILSGIDREEPTSEGWWETSKGAQFGATKLAELVAAIEKADAVIIAATGQVELWDQMEKARQARWLPHTDYWHQSISERKEALQAAVSALTAAGES